MKGHEAIERILATYRDAQAEERARADAHIAGCPACAARLAAFGEVDAALAGLSQPAPPARLARPLAAPIAAQDRSSVATNAHRFTLTRTFASVAIVFTLLAALSAIIWSLNSGRPPVTATPTLTMTLTPTTVTVRETEPVAPAGHASPQALIARRALMAEPTPAPVPAPTAGMPGIRLAGYDAHATMIH